MTDNTSSTSDRQDISSVKQLNNSWSTYHAGISRDYGVSESLFVSYVYRWIKHNIKNGINVQDGRVWTYGSIGSIRKKIKCWTDSQFKLIVKKCVDKGLILVSKSQENKYDKTNWYSLTDYAMRMCQQADANPFIANFQERSNESNSHLLERRIRELEEENLLLKEEISRHRSPIKIMMSCVSKLIGGPTHAE